MDAAGGHAAQDGREQIQLSGDGAGFSNGTIQVIDELPLLLTHTFQLLELCGLTASQDVQAADRGVDSAHL